MLVAVHNTDVFLKELGNREWCYSIECIGLYQDVPPSIIFKRTEINLNWNIQAPEITEDWHFYTSPKG